MESKVGGSMRGLSTHHANGNNDGAAGPREDCEEKCNPPDTRLYHQVITEAKVKESMLTGKPIENRSEDEL